ncbi:MAG: DNA polymerase III subunit [Planctomycetes bacterium]|nr:DNA polymerase III subunit [Planctomycetota bacterium]
MSWHGICGHDEVVDRFRRALGRRRLASSFLFVGPEGIGKRAFALKLAQALLCERRPEEALDPCGECPACLQVAAASHPDLHLVAKPKDKAFLPLELLVGDKEHRMRQGLCRNIALKPMMGGRKIAILDDADFLNVEGANSLLKTLEEPPPRSVLILITTSAARQLPTIRSRCQLIRFGALSTDLVAELLAREGLVEDADEAQRLARYSEGSLRNALDLADPELWSFRTRLFEQLAQPVLESVRLAKSLAAFVDEAGKQAAARRQRLRQVVGFALGFYRHLVVVLSGAAPEADDELREAVGRAKERWPGDALTASACLDRCLEASDQIARNANMATLVECWLDDLGTITATGISTVR